jgi:hypothetical protein
MKESIVLPGLKSIPINIVNFTLSIAGIEINVTRESHVTSILGMALNSVPPPEVEMLLPNDATYNTTWLLQTAALLDYIFKEYFHEI